MTDSLNHTTTILLVDDEPMGLEVLHGLLSSENYNLAFASNGTEAIAKAMEIVPDVILLDVMMPDIDGFEVCRRLRTDPILADVPIIMLTALDDRESRLEGIESGADDFISKPFDRIELRTRLRTITRLNRFRRLHIERNKFEWVVEQSEDGYLVIDSRGKIKYVNASARTYLNLPIDPDVKIKETFQTLVSKQYRREPEVAWRKENLLQLSSNAPTVPRYLVRPETKTAHAFWLKVDILYINAPSITSEWIIRLVNVTPKMSLQRDMWQFQAMIAHKLRTPFSSILGNLSLLAEESEDFEPHELSEMAQRAARGVQRLHNEIEDIVLFVNTRNQHNNTIVPEKFQLLKLKPLLKTLCDNLNLASLTFIEETSLPDKAKIPISAQNLQTILDEIIENSYRFHPTHTPNISITTKLASPNKISIQIMDDGLNLSPEQFSYIWVPYYQGEKFFTGEIGGMGLGLPMVASLVWSANGHCQAFNRPSGAGIIIELIFPLIEN